MARTKRDLYREVTDQIIAKLEKGVVPWVKPWDSESSLPVNAVSGRNYRGINVPLLWAEAMEKGYQSDRWATFKQAKEAGGNVKRGEKGTTIVFWKPVESKEEEIQDDKKRFFPLLRAFTVFNVAQVDGLPPIKEKPVVWEPDVLADQFLSLANVQHGGGRAFFAPTPDIIQLPSRSSFPDHGSYYATALHELVHWSGHDSRLNRLSKTPYGSPDYAREELVAEMGSAFLTADAGIEGKTEHPEYLAEWLKILGSDKKAIFQAASKAQAAVDYLREEREKQTVKAVLESSQRVINSPPDTGPQENTSSVAA